MKCPRFLNGGKKVKPIKPYKMNEVINYVERIFKSYDISFINLNAHRTKMLLLESSDPERLRKHLKERYDKEINLEEAKELEILLLTYQYISSN